MGVRRFIVAGAVLATASCETYEFPPRLSGVGTEDCPDCEELVLSESRLPPGSVSLRTRFAFHDDRGAVDAIRVFVTSPSGAVLEESYFVEVEREVEVPVDTDGAETDGDTEGETMTIVVTVEEERRRPGFTCSFVEAASVTIGSRLCEITTERFNGVVEGTVAQRLSGYSQGIVTAAFGLQADELGDWTVEFEAQRSTGTPSNRLSNTFEVAADVGDDTDTDE
jgi:hypothetical protein